MGVGVFIGDATVHAMVAQSELFTVGYGRNLAA